MKTNKAAIILITVALVTAALVAGCSGGELVRGSGNVVSESREVGGFERVNACCGMALIITQGTPTSLEIEADDNLLSEIRTVITGDTLTIEYAEMGPRRNYETSQSVRCLLTVDSLSGISVSGGGSLEAGELNVTDLAIELSGGSTGSIDALQAKNLDLTLNGGGSAFISGIVEHQNAGLNGGSQYSAADLQSLTASVSINDGGGATIWVTEDLTVNLNGGSRLEYYGSPQISSQSLNGGSEIESLGER